MGFQDCLSFELVGLNELLADLWTKRENEFRRITKWKTFRSTGTLRKAANSASNTLGLTCKIGGENVIFLTLNQPTFVDDVCQHLNHPSTHITEDKDIFLWWGDALNSIILIGWPAMHRSTKPETSARTAAHKFPQHQSFKFSGSGSGHLEAHPETSLGASAPSLHSLKH
jgi:hypothetical protein